MRVAHVLAVLVHNPALDVRDQRAHGALQPREGLAGEERQRRARLGHAVRLADLRADAAPGEPLEHAVVQRGRRRRRADDEEPERGQVEGVDERVRGEERDKGRREHRDLCAA